MRTGPAFFLKGGDVPTINRDSLRLAVTLLVLGEILFVLVGIFHPGREQANSHTAVVAEYAEDSIRPGRQRC